MKTSKNILKAVAAATIIGIAFFGLEVSLISNVSAQGGGINPTNSIPDPSAGLDGNFSNIGYEGGGGDNSGGEGNGGTSYGSGGGGSFNGGTNPSNTPGFQSGNGQSYDYILAKKLS